MPSPSTSGALPRTSASRSRTPNLPLWRHHRRSNLQRTCKEPRRSTRQALLRSKRQSCRPQRKTEPLRLTETPTNLKLETGNSELLNSPVEATQAIVVLDFGSQYTQLIARRIRELNVFSVVLPCYAKLEEIVAYKPIGIVLSGGPSSVYDKDAPPM